MPELRHSKVQIMVLASGKVRRARDTTYEHMNEKASILTPTHATAVSRLFRIGTMCLPLVTELSKLGLKASPENSVKSPG